MTEATLQQERERETMISAARQWPGDLILRQPIIGSEPVIQTELQKWEE